MSSLSTGKLPLDLLNDLLSRYARTDESVLVGPGVGVDAAVVTTSGDLLVAKSDPITFATDEIGWYAVHVNANDVACLGATPRWFLATLLLPEGRTTAKLVEDIFAQLDAACRSLNVLLVGGHTEITYGLDRPIVSGHMLGTVPPEGLITPAGARPGDRVLIVRGFPIEGTSIIARERADELRRRGYDESTIQAAQRFLYEPGISVVRAAQVLLESGPVHALHDPTEGGVATGLLELALAAGLGIEVEAEALPVLPLGQRLCAEFGLDPFGTIASGALLAAVPPNSVSAHLKALEEAGIPAANVGQLLPPDRGCWLLVNGERRPLPRFPADEITKLFAG